MDIVCLVYDLGEIKIAAHREYTSSIPHTVLYVDLQIGNICKMIVIIKSVYDDRLVSLFLLVDTWKNLCI